ncbi:unnamed protein product [Timema podura]|uniref:Uncharacterized protein n=1 Tax=Timema podura TaxID=61482 RepID=A0ABN7NXU0_TIMPD|nr:unnamed protein product [Timema podura]
MKRFYFCLFENQIVDKIKGKVSEEVFYVMKEIILNVASVIFDFDSIKYLVKSVTATFLKKTDIAYSRPVTLLCHLYLEGIRQAQSPKIEFCRGSRAVSVNSIDLSFHELSQLFHERGVFRVPTLRFLSASSSIPDNAGEK